MSTTTLLENPASVLLEGPSEEMLERVEAYNRQAAVSFTEWMARILARRTAR